jgi:tetratricopeptide (TPR) repeat protein
MFSLFIRHPILRSIWLLGLLVVTPSVASGQSSQASPEITQSSRAFYRGDYAQAARIAETHLRGYPNDVPVRVLLARVHLAQGQYLQAFEQLRRAVISEPQNIDALYYLSLTARQLSQEEYQRLFALAPDSDRSHQLLAEAALAAENRSEAETEFQKALKANPRSVEVLTELAELKRAQSKFDEAIAYYAEAEQIGPLNYDIAYGLGACYTYKQDYPQASEWLHKAVILAPDSAAGRFALGNVLFQSGQFESAIPELKTSLKIEPGMKQAYFLLGRAYSKLGRQAEAQAAFKKLNEPAPPKTPAPARKSSARVATKSDSHQ